LEFAITCPPLKWSYHDIERSPQNSQMNYRKIAKTDLLREKALVRAYDPTAGGSLPSELQSRAIYPEETFDVRTIFDRLFKRKFQILVVTVIVLVPAAIATFLAIPLYRSTAVIQFNLDSGQVLPYRDIAESGSGAGSYDSALMTQEQILRSPILVGRVVPRLASELKSETKTVEQYLQKHQFEIRRIAASQLLQISWLNPSPEMSAKGVNVYAEEYMKQHYESRQAAREKARQGLARELESLEKRVQLSEKELVEYARDNNIMSVEPGQDLVEKKLGVMDQHVAEIEAELTVARSRMQAVEKASVKDFPEKYSTSVIQALTSNVLNLEHQLTALRASYGENWPEVIQKRNELALVRDQLAREKAVVLAQAREQARLDLQTVETRHRMMSVSLAEQKGFVNRFRKASIQYNILRREVETNKKLYEGLLERLKQTGVMAGLEFGNIQVIEPAIPNHTPDSPKILWNLALASFLGLALGVCFAFFADFWDNSFSTIEQLEQLAAVPGLGVMPLIDSSKANRFSRVARPNRALESRRDTRLLQPTSGTSVQRGNPDPGITEAIRTICASILLSRCDREPHVIVVTSAEPGEGKTTITSHLGRELADHGFSTLMIEGDLRKPGLSQLFRVGNEEGLSLFLSGHVRPLPKIHNTDNPNLWLIAAGPKPPNPVALLNSEKMGSFLYEMASLFKFVIIDSPPVLAVADARTLGVKSDGVVLVVRAGKTPKSAVLQASALIANSGANTLGVVLNGAEVSARSAYYYAYYRATTET
jgi:succinoglycan biosynthesis transport protein ExoP